MEQASLPVQDILPKLISLKNLIATIPFLKNDNEACLELKNWVEKLQSMTPTHILSEDDAVQIKMEIESVKSSFDSKILS